MSNEQTSETDDLIALIPAGGWRVLWTSPDGSQHSGPLVGWGLAAGNDVSPLVTDTTGLVLRMDPEHIKGEWEIYHPDVRDGR